MRGSSFAAVAALAAAVAVAAVAVAVGSALPVWAFGPSVTADGTVHVGGGASAEVAQGLSVGSGGIDASAGGTVELGAGAGLLVSELQVPEGADVFGPGVNLITRAGTVEAGGVGAGSAGLQLGMPVEVETAPCTAGGLGFHRAESRLMSCVGTRWRWAGTNTLVSSTYGKVAGRPGVDCGDIRHQLNTRVDGTYFVRDTTRGSTLNETSIPVYCVMATDAAWMLALQVDNVANASALRPTNVGDQGDFPSGSIAAAGKLSDATIARFVKAGAGRLGYRVTSSAPGGIPFYVTADCVYAHTDAGSNTLSAACRSYTATFTADVVAATDLIQCGHWGPSEGGLSAWVDCGNSTGNTPTNVFLTHRGVPVYPTTAEYAVPVNPTGRSLGSVNAIYSNTVSMWIR